MLAKTEKLATQQWLAKKESLPYWGQWPEPAVAGPQRYRTSSWWWWWCAHWMILWMMMLISIWSWSDAQGSHMAGSLSIYMYLSDFLNPLTPDKCWCTPCIPLCSIQNKTNRPVSQVCGISPQDKHHCVLHPALLWRLPLPTRVVAIFVESAYLSMLVILRLTHLAGSVDLLQDK